MNKALERSLDESMASSLRPLMEEAYKTLEEGSVPVIIAPTSYGKTRASPEFYRRAVASGLAAGLIHVVPMRSLVRRIFDEHFRPLKGGYQSMDSLDDGNKTPYFLRHPVVTTLESYVWNTFRVPVAEFAKIEQRVSEGHYYPALAAISSSVNVFDEVHLYLGEEQGLSHATVTSIIGYLARLDVPIVLETATMHPHTLSDIIATISRYKQGVKLLVLNTGDLATLINILTKQAKGRWVNTTEVILVDDPQWVEDNHFEWETLLVDDENQFIRSACSDAEEGLVLLVRNTVSRAVDTYQRVVIECPSLGVNERVLVHGRLSNKDRADAEKLLDKLRVKGRGLVVATQVAEAGLDLNASTVYTDLAPIENLVQRANRSCRRGDALSYCRDQGGKLTILRPKGDAGELAAPYDPDEVSQTLDIIKEHLEGGININWRLTLAEGDSGEVGPGGLISRVRKDSQNGGIPISLIRQQLDSHHVFDMPPSMIFSLLDRLEVCSLLSNDMLVRVYLDDTASDYVVVSLNWLKNKLGQAGGGHSRIVQVDERGAPIIIVRSGKGVAKGVLSRRLQSTRRCGDAYKIIKEAVTHASRSLGYGMVEWGFIASPGSYVEGLGLTGG